MDIFNELPTKKSVHLNRLFQNCTEEVKKYMYVMEREKNITLIKAGDRCSHIYIILSGKAVGIDWPISGRAYSFKDFGPGDFFGEIECFADLSNYRISVVTVTTCKILAIPVPYYIEWVQNDPEALYSRTKINMRRLITQTTDARRFLFLDGRNRLILYLMRKFEEQQFKSQTYEVILNHTRDQLVEEIGFSLKTLNRNIKKLQELTFITIKKGKIAITEEEYQRMKTHMDQQIYGEI